MNKPIFMSRRTVLAGLATFACTRVEASSITLPAPDPKDTCPVCGMFVAPYRYWIATILFNDGRSVHFDGAKDLHKYLTDMARWAGGRKASDIAKIGVTSYYDTTMIEAKNAFYVIGSDVLGPMGHELVPHETKQDAEEFMRDHKGRRIVNASDIKPALLSALDDGRFE